MATDQRTILFDSSSDATMRTWVSGVSAALRACGLVATTDTGQLNLTTFVKNSPTATSGEIITGYEMYRFSDALQATRPIFIKVEYGHIATYNIGITSTGLPGPPVIYVTVGTATNGAGTITGAIISNRTRMAGATGSFQANYGGSVNTGTIVGGSPCYFQGDNSCIMVVLGVTNSAQQLHHGGNTGRVTYTSFPAMLVVERTRNTDGTPNGDGAIFMTCKWENSSENTAPTTTTPTHQVFNFVNNSLTVNEGMWPVTWPQSNAFSTSAVGPDLYTFPIATSTPKPQQLLSVLGIYKGDVSLGSTLSLMVLGTLRTYRSLAGIAGVTSNDNARPWINSWVQNGALLMRWE